MYFYIGFTVIILILLAIVIFRKPDVIIKEETNKSTKDYITLLEKQCKTSEVKVKNLEHQCDSLSSLEPKIEYRTNEKIKFILTIATPNELDSCIRANWKSKSRYH